jgi:hypothetical protein
LELTTTIVGNRPGGALDPSGELMLERLAARRRP